MEMARAKGADDDRERDGGREERIKGEFKRRVREIEIQGVSVKWRL